MKSVKPEELRENPFELIGKEWMLAAAGTPEKYNMMTASWGGLGVMWNKNVAVTVIRPTRYTYRFVNESEYFTLSFYGSEKALHKICGGKSGRDTDKAKEAGLTPVFRGNGLWFEGARLVLVCRKLYVSDIRPENFVDSAPLKWYDNDFHRMFVGEIEEVWVAE